MAVPSFVYAEGAEETPTSTPEATEEVEETEAPESPTPEVTPSEEPSQEPTSEETEEPEQTQSPESEITPTPEATDEVEAEVEKTPAQAPRRASENRNVSIEIQDYYKTTEQTFTLKWNDNKNGNSSRTEEEINKISNAFQNALVITAKPASGDSLTIHPGDTNYSEIILDLQVNSISDPTDTTGITYTINFGSADAEENTTGLPKTVLINGTEYTLTYSLQDYTPENSAKYIYQVKEKDEKTLYATETMDFTGTIQWLDGKDLNATRPDVSTYVQSLSLYRFPEGDRGSAQVLLDGFSNASSFQITNKDGTELSTSTNDKGQKEVNDWKLTISKLPMYDLDGTPYSYYVNQKVTTNSEGTETNFSKKPVEEIDFDDYENSYHDNLSKGDYVAKFDNQQSDGNYKSDETYLQNGGTVSNTIENTIWIDLGKEWIDEGSLDGRNATFSLYRISEDAFMSKGFDQDGSPVTGYDTSSVQNTNEDGSDPSASGTTVYKHIGIQIATIDEKGNIISTNNTLGETLKFDDEVLNKPNRKYVGAVPLYSSEGNRYIYYAVESTPSGYKATANNAYYSTGSAVKYNEQTVTDAANAKNYVILGNSITNEKTGDVSIPAIKTFANLGIQEIQDTTVTMALQVRKVGDENWTWYSSTDVNSLKEHLGEDYNTYNETKPYALEDSTTPGTYHVLATLSGFSADRFTMEQECSMPLYDSDFNQLEYQWVEVDINFSNAHTITKSISLSNDKTKVSLSDDTTGLLQSTGENAVSSPILKPDQSESTGGNAAPGTASEKTTLLFKASYDNGVTTNTMPAPVNFKLTKKAYDATEKSIAGQERTFTYQIYANGKLLTEDVLKEFGVSDEELTTLKKNTKSGLGALLENGKGETSLTVTVASSAQDAQEASTILYGLPRYDRDGKEISYTAIEATNGEQWHTTISYSNKVVDYDLDNVITTENTEAHTETIQILEKSANFTNSRGPGSEIFIDASKQWLDDSMVDTRHPVTVALVNAKENKVEQFATLSKANDWYARFTINNDDKSHSKDDYVVIEVDVGSSSSYSGSTYNDSNKNISVSYTSDVTTSDDDLSSYSTSMTSEQIKAIADRVNAVITQVNKTSAKDGETHMYSIFSNNTDDPSKYLSYCVGTIRESKTNTNVLQQDYNVYIGREAGKNGADYEYTIYNQRVATLNLHITKTWKDAGDFLDANFEILRDNDKFAKFSLTKNSTTFKQEEGSVAGSVKWTSLKDDKAEGFTSTEATQGGISNEKYADGDYPKYDALGRVYTYGVKEVSVGGTVSGTTATNVTYEDGTDYSLSYSGVANVTDNSGNVQKYSVNVAGTTLDTDYATSSNHYYKGVYSWKVDNTRSEKIDLEVNKVWRDNGTYDRILTDTDGNEIKDINGNAAMLKAIETARASITLSLYRITTKDYQEFMNDHKDMVSSSGDVVTDLKNISSSKSEQEQKTFQAALLQNAEEIIGSKNWNTKKSNWWWHAGLGSYDRYDQDGYPYIYFVVENIVDDAAGYQAKYFNGSLDTYSSGYQPVAEDPNYQLDTDGYAENTKYKTTKDVFNPESNQNYNATDYNCICTVLVDGQEHTSNQKTYYSDYYSSTVVNTPEKELSVSGKKIWKLQTGKEIPTSYLPEVTFYLYRSLIGSYTEDDFLTNGSPSTTSDTTKQYEYLGTTTTEAPNYLYSFKNANKTDGNYEYYNEYGQKYVYYILEGTVFGYKLTSTEGDFNLTNIYQLDESQGTVKINVKKLWDQDYDPQNIKATFKLYGYSTDKDGNVIQSQKYLLATTSIDGTANKTDGNLITFGIVDSTNELGLTAETKIPYYSPSTYPFAFEVEEVVNGYSVKTTGFTKVAITESSEYSETNDPTILMTDNATVDDNKKVYSTNLGIQNTYAPGSGQINIQKNWANDAHYQNRRTDVSVILSRKYTYKENTETKTVTEYATGLQTKDSKTTVTDWTFDKEQAGKIVLTSSDKYKKTIQELRNYAQNGTKYSYAIEEVEVTDGVIDGLKVTITKDKVSLEYKITQGSPVNAGGTTTVTNSLETTSVTGKKVWKVKDDNEESPIVKKLSDLNDEQLVALVKSGALPKYFRFYLVDKNGNYYTKDGDNYSFSTTTDNSNGIHQDITLKSESAEDIKTYLSDLETGKTFDKLAKFTTSDGPSATYSIAESYSFDNQTWVTQFPGKEDGSVTFEPNNNVFTYTNTIDVAPVVVKKVWNDDYNSQNTRPTSLSVTLKNGETTLVTIQLTKDNILNNVGNEYISEVLYLPTSALDTAVAVEADVSGYTASPSNKTASLHKKDGNRDTLQKSDLNCYYFELNNSIKKVYKTKTLDVSATKTWVNYDSSYEAIGFKDVYFTLQYSSDGKTWQKVDSTCGLSENQSATITLTPDNGTHGYIENGAVKDVTVTWTGLHQYQDKTENTVEAKPYQYRVIESDKDGNIVTPFGYIVSYQKQNSNGTYTGEQSEPISFKGNVGDQSFKITNTSTIESFDIQLTKQWKDNQDSSSIRKEAEFELQWKNADGEWGKVEGTSSNEEGSNAYLIKSKNPQTLKEDGTITWTVPKYQTVGEEKKQLIEYRVIEKDLDGYESTLTEETSKSFTAESYEEIEVQNTIQTTSVKIIKHAKEDDTKLLAGAHYILTRTMNEEMQYFAGSDNKDGVATWSTDRSKAFEAITGEDGTVTVEGLPIGSYVIYEVEAPEGYEVDSTGLPFEISKENLEEIQEVNQADPLIPEEPEKPDQPDEPTATPETDTNDKKAPDTSDHSNVVWYSILNGISLMAVAGLLLLRKKKA